MATKTLKRKPVELTKEEQVLEAFDNYKETVVAILESYFANEPGLMVELEAANDNFEKVLKEEVILDKDVDDLIAELEEKDLNANQIKALVEVVKDSDEFDAADVLELFDEQDVFDASSLKGWASIKIENLAQHQKLESFILRELYPHENESDNYSLTF